MRGCPPVRQPVAPIATRLGQLAGGHRIFWQPLPKCCRSSVELTAYKSYSIPADVLGVFAASHANIWRCGLKVTPVPARFRLHPHLACRLPYRFPRGRFTRLLRVRVPAPWLPYRFPRGRLGVGVTAFRQQPWLPYRFPRGRFDRRNGGSKSDQWLPTDCGPHIILLDAALTVGKREPRGLVRCTPFHAMCATRGEL